MEAVAEGAGAAGDLERRVMAVFEAAEKRGDPPLVRAMEVGRCVLEKGLGFPNLELGQVLVSNLCFSNNSPSLWKLLDQAIASRLLSPFHTLALLTARVIPNRRAEPEAYRLYLELLSRYLFFSPSVETTSSRDKITNSVDDALQLSCTYGIHKIDFGHAVIFFVLRIIVTLIDGVLEDWGLKFGSPDKKGSRYLDEGHQVMDIDANETSTDKTHEHRDQLRRANTLMALEVVEKITANGKAKAFLHAIHIHMPERFNSLLQRLQFIEAHKSTSQDLMSANYTLVKLFANLQTIVSGECQINKHRLLRIFGDAGAGGPTSGYNFGVGRDACWITFDVFMENAMDGRNLHAISAIEILTELTKTLQVVNQANWQETFLALWVSALRLTQRDREPREGPVPHLEARLCMLLSIVPLAIVPVIQDESETPYSRTTYEHGMERNKLGSRRQGLIFSLQVLGQFSGLLSPPPSVVNAANNAASKAATFISNLKTGSGNLGADHNDGSVKAVGNMLHLIVEACIARKLVDTSAYFWPGYVVPSATSKDSMSVQESPWSTFMEGAQLTGPLKNALMANPASSINELEKLQHIALNGSEEEKSAAAKILCGASLLRGWNIQEHVVRIVLKLLSPPVPPDFQGPAGSHLIGYMPMLSSILFGVSCVDIVHTFALYGMVPEIAAALMPLCEAFGSLLPPSGYRSSPSDETSIYSVFSCAFLFLLRLWKFYKPPQEHCIAGRGGPVRSELTLDCLLLMRNDQIALQNSAARDRPGNITDPLISSQRPPVYIESCPKLRAWYLQNQACIASTLSGLSSKNPVHQVANKILNMICRKMNKVGNVSGNPSSNSSGSISGSPVNTTEDAYERPTLPAWEVLEAIPFVLEAVLTACAHGRISSRDLTTGLRDLVDFLPASLATIVSYFSAEITRGIWKPVPMNGTDWPSPAANLLSVESEIKEILASVGVQRPSCYASGMAPMLPLPMAALVSLTITFKLDKSLNYIHGVVGQALENCATGCSWPSMPIIGALWTQKVRRWHDFIVFSCARSPFTGDKEAVAQLIRSCFSSFLGGRGADPLSSLRGVSGLLGHAISDGGLRLPVSPGFLYLRSCRNFLDTHFVCNVILQLVAEWAHKLAARHSCSGSARLRSGQNSLAAAAAGVQEIAALGASLLCIAGGGQVVQVLYEETVPAALLSAREGGRMGPLLGPTAMLEGYAMAYLVLLSGAFIWGVGDTSPVYKSVLSFRRARAIGMHVEFVAGVVDGKVALGCDPATWKAYVSCFVGLLVRFVPAWIPEVKKETLQKLANGLRGWHEFELALELLKHGGPSAFTAVVESVL